MRRENIDLSDFVETQRILAFWLSVTFYWPLFPKEKRTGVQKECWENRGRERRTHGSSSKLTVESK